MRLSDWSSDVCSSDLRSLSRRPRGTTKTPSGTALRPRPVRLTAASTCTDATGAGAIASSARAQPPTSVSSVTHRTEVWMAIGLDRESVVLGKGVSVRVDLGGRRILKKTQTEHRTKTMYE